MSLIDHLVGIMKNMEENPVVRAIKIKVCVHVVPRKTRNVTKAHQIRV